MQPYFRDHEVIVIGFMFLYYRLWLSELQAALELSVKTATTDPKPQC